MQQDRPRELANEGNDVPALIATIPASVQQRRTALGVVIFFSVVFVVAIPFASQQVGRVDAFIPVVQSIICVTDIITAALLFAQYWVGFLLFYKRLNFRVPIVRPAFSAAERTVQCGCLTSGA